jgi:cephalosporin-C deacetylase-like acetyl esterase
VTGYGALRRNGYTIEKLIFESEPGIPVPAILAIPDQRSSKHEAILYVDGRGKSAVAPRLEQWMKEGTLVMAIDVRGLGETRTRRETPRYTDDWFGDASNTFAAMLLGKTLVGMRAFDISRAIDVLSARADLQAASIRAIGVEHGSVATLYAAAFDQRIRSVELERMLESYRSVVESRVHRGVFEDVVPGALREFDLPDLVTALGARVVRVSDPVDAMGEVR